MASKFNAAAAMKRALIVSLAVVLTLSLSLVPLPAQTVQANPGTIHVPGDHATIQGAIDAALVGDTILVAPGTYNENITITKADLTVLGSGASETTIHANSSSSPVVTITSAANAIISGFTITGGQNGIDNRDNAAIIANNLIIHNTSYGILIMRTNSTVVNNTIVSNTTTGVRIYDCSPVISNNIIADTYYGVWFRYPVGNPMYPALSNNDVYANLYGDKPSARNYWDERASQTYSTPPSDIVSNPLFADPTSDDYHLLVGSPCIDAGSNGAVPGWLTEDFEGDDRIWDGDDDGDAVVDIGVDEYILKNTGTGSDVTVSFPDEGVDVSFTEVTKAGNTTVTTSGSGPAEIPSGFVLAGDYYEINTSAGYSGNVTICIEYNPAGISGSEEELSLYHYEEDSWVDVTTDVDIEANKIYGEVSSLSAFAVLDPNQPPVAEDDGYAVDEDDTLAVAAPGVLENDADADGDPLTADLDSDVSHGTLTLSDNGSFSYTPDADFNGTDSFAYVASDGIADSDPATVTVTIDPVNDEPEASDDSATTDEDMPVTIDVLANDDDVDDDTLIVASVTQGANGSVTDNGDGTVTYNPAADFYGADSFTYTVDDGNGGSDEATVSITITAVNDAPAAADDDYAVDEGETLEVAAPGVLENDTDTEDETLTANLDSDVSHGTLTLNEDGSFSYTPEDGFSGTDSFTYVASDGSDDSDPAAVTITVNPVQTECNFASFSIRHMIVREAPDRGNRGSRWWRWFKWLWPKESDTFHIWGKLQLPDSYSLADLGESATLTVTITDESGGDTVSFQKRSLGRWGTLWRYKGKSSSDEELNVTQMTIWWTAHRGDWATFYIKGEFELPEDVDKDAEATVTLEVPLTDGAGCESLTGEDTVEFRVFRTR